jgi:hypothetical protein
VHSLSSVLALSLLLAAAVVEQVSGNDHLNRTQPAQDAGFFCADILTMTRWPTSPVTAATYYFCCL